MAEFPTAIGSLGSDSRASFARSVAGPKRIAPWPNPFGTMRATGSSPARTAASAVAAV